MLTAHVRDFCHRISLWAALWAGADGVSCWMFIAYRRPSARIAGRRLPDTGARSRVLHGRFTVKAARRESPGTGRQRTTLPIVRQEIVRRGMTQYGIVQRGFSPASERLSDNSQRNTGVFNDLPVTVQGISGQPLTGRKPDNSIPSLLLSDPAVSLLPAGFLFSRQISLLPAEPSFSRQSLPSPADNTTSREAGITMPTINHPTTRPSHNGSAAS